MTEIGGLDWSFARPDPVALAHAGFTFAMRYVSNSPGKNLSAGELAALNAAGLRVGLVWETTANRVLAGAAGGSADGAAAAQQAAALGYPTTAVIFFAVDYDAQPADFPTISAYAQAFNTACANPVGIYGGFAVVEHFVTPGQPPVAYGWQTAAWSGGRLSAKAHLYQRAQPTNWPAVAGCDENIQCWTLPLAGSPIAPPPPSPSPLPPGGSVTASDLTPAAVQQVSDAVANRTYEGIPGQPGARPAWLVAVETHETVLALKAELDGLLAKVAAPAAVTVDQAAADQIAASLVANPQFQQLVANAASKVVLAEDADLAKRFGPQ